VNASFSQSVPQRGEGHRVAGGSHVPDALHKRHALQVQEDMAAECSIETRRIVAKAM
jgi:hypothetical protein